MSLSFAFILIIIKKLLTIYSILLTTSEYIRTTLEFSDEVSENFQISLISIGFYFSRIVSENSEIAWTITKILMLIHENFWSFRNTKTPQEDNEDLFCTTNEPYVLDFKWLNAKADWDDFKQSPF